MNDTAAEREQKDGYQYKRAWTYTEEEEERETVHVETPALEINEKVFQLSNHCVHML